MSISMLWPWMFGSFLIALAATPLVARFARRVKAIDVPTDPRKIHTIPTPLLGGLGIYIAVAALTDVALFFSDRLTSGEITLRHYAGVLLGGLVLMIGGALDDRFRLPPRVTILFPILAALLALAGGIEVTKLTNPLGGVILLEPWQSSLLVFVWLMVVMYTTKLLDGLDGLVTGVGSVGVFAVLLLTLTTAYAQPDVALWSAIGLGALLGFLVWNWHPAKIFLGEGGSTFVGYFLGVLAVISGGKLATALLVLGLPFLDLLWTIGRRLTHQPRSIFSGDRRHLHHRLLDAGLPQSVVASGYILVALLLAVGGLFLQSREKAFAFLALSALLLLLMLVLSRRRV